MAIQSKFYSNCPYCHKRIKRGDWIDNKKGKWGHVKCNNGSSKNASVASALLNNPIEVQDTEHNVSFSTDFIPSPFQVDIFDFIVNGEGNGVIEAVAGSGKTTTIVKALEYIPLALLIDQKVISKPTPLDLSIIDEHREQVDYFVKQYHIAFLAFNKHIATELKRRAPDYVHVSTLHSLGYSIMVHKFIGIQVDEDKVGSKMDDFWPVGKTKTVEDIEVENPSYERATNRMKRSAMRKLVSIMKSTLVNYEIPEKVEETIEYYGIDIPEDLKADVLSKLTDVMHRCKADTRTMDFDDMIWLPIVHNLQLAKFHYLFIDEGQDLNNCQTQYILRSLENKGRIIVVGDRKQSLYGFRGADTEAIPRLIEMLHAKVLPLSITYRCPISHVKRAKVLVPQIEASETAIEGTVQEIKYDKFLLDIEVGDMVICRTNAPLVKPAFEAIRRGKKAIIRGRDIGRSLIEFIDRFEASDLGQLDLLMAEYTAVEVQRLLDRSKELQAEMVMDKFLTIQTVARECKSIPDLIVKLKMLFDDTNVGIVFSSVHRAKGLEANRVFILRPDLMPHPKAKQLWETQQEDNCYYVALTRSKQDLFFVEGEF